MNLVKAQNILWSLLDYDQRIKHKKAYKLALSNLEDGLAETILDNIKVNKDAPAALYFPMDENLQGQSQPNIVGKVQITNGNTIVIFQSKDIIELLTLYYGNNILNI